MLGRRAASARGCVCPRRAGVHPTHPTLLNSTKTPNGSRGNVPELTVLLFTDY